MSSDPSSNPAQPQRLLKNDRLFATVLLIVTVIAYHPAWSGKPVWDDDAHLTTPELRSLTGLFRIWFEPGATQQYYPLVHSAFWLQQKIWGDSTTGYHLVNILLHVSCAVMLMKILRSLGVPGAHLAAAIFALHPIEVESVAWISELKNTLSGAFYFGAALAYLRFDRRRDTKYYAIALLLFFLGLFCKTVIATLPAALLVVFWWKRGTLSWKKNALLLLPFFALGIFMGLLTPFIETKYVIGGDKASFTLTLAERFLVAGRVFWFYIGKLLWPANLTFIYPHWDMDHAAAWQYLFPLAAVFFVAVLWVMRKRGRSPLAAVLFYGGTLFPALGFANIYSFLYSYVADHFQYLAGIGIITLASAGAACLHDRLRGPGRLALQVATAILLTTLFVLTWRQSRIYVDAHTLYTATLKQNPGCGMAWNNLGNELLVNGKTDEAIDYFNKSLALKPGDARAETNLGQAYYQKGRVDEAIAHFQKALAAADRLDDPLPEANIDLGNILLRQGRMDEALAHYESAVKVDSHNAATHNGLGNIYFYKGDMDGAGAEYKKALEIRPDLADLHNNLGNVYLQKGNLNGAVSEYEETLKLQPDHAKALNNLAWLLSTSPSPSSRDGSRAVELALKANRISGGENAGILGTLAAAYAEAGRFPEAVEAARHALRIATASNNTGMVTLLNAQLKFYESGAPYHQGQ